MQWSWFDLHWPWLGLAFSATLLLLLFTTNIFRSNLSNSRWFDPVWLAWLAPAAYMIHQFEEYGIDARGVRFAFPDVLSASMGMPPYPESALPTALFIAINIPAIWIAGLACGLASWRHPFVGLGVYAIHFTNSLSHLGVALASGSYNPGALSAALIQLPISVWVGYACFVRGRMRGLGIVVLIVAGTLLSVVLLGSVKAFSKGLLSTPVLLTIQVLNPLFVILLPWWFEKRVLRPTEASR